MDGKQKESSKYLPSFRIFPFEFDDEDHWFRSKAVGQHYPLNDAS